MAIYRFTRSFIKSVSYDSDFEQCFRALLHNVQKMDLQVDLADNDRGVIVVRYVVRILNMVL